MIQDEKSVMKNAPTQDSASSNWLKNSAHGEESSSYNR
jgi:hypothetical protein